MTFAEIILKNIYKRIGSYIAYFFSTAFSVIVFYLFCAMYYNHAFSVYRFGSGKMSTLFQGAAVAVLVFAAIFVFYSGSCFIRGRKKEIAIYSLLGMPKKTIALMLFGETFFIGMLAVLLGTGIGNLSAGYIMKILMRVMAIGTSVSYTVSPMAILVTSSAFAVLFIISGIFAYRIIYRYSLIDLLSATKQSEGVPRYSLIAAWIALVFIAFGYCLASRMELNAFGVQLLLPTALVVIVVSLGTFLLFRNTLPMFIAMMKQKKTLYYQTATFISTSQLAFRLKANARMLTLSALLCTIAITMVSASVSLYRGLEQTVDIYAPFSYLAKDITPEQDAEIEQTVTELGEVQITVEDRIVLLKAKIQNDSYAVQTGTETANTPGKPAEAYILSQSAYQQIITDTQAKQGNASSLRTNFTGGLSDDTCYFIDGNMTDKYSAGLVGQGLSVTFHGKSHDFNVSGAGLHKYIGLLDLYQRPTVVVSDAVYEQYLTDADSTETDTFYGYMFNDEMNSANTIAALDAFIPARFGNGGLPANASYIGIYKANFALYGSYVFIGLFIGILFLLALCSVMYYKMIMEAQEERQYYVILRKIGMKKKEILSAVAKKLGIVFGAPLAVGLVHTIIALNVYNRMMELIGQETPILANAMTVAGLFILVYGLFYLMAIRNYFTIVWKKIVVG